MPHTNYTSPVAKWITIILKRDSGEEETQFYACHPECSEFNVGSLEAMSPVKDKDMKMLCCHACEDLIGFYNPAELPAMPGKRWI